MTPAETIDNIVMAHRARIFAMRSRMRGDLALLSYIRLQLGWSRSLPENERKQIAKQAMEEIARVKRGEESDFIAEISANFHQRKPFDKIEKDASRRIENYAKTLPVWDAFGDGVRGFGALGLGIIVAEAGDLSNYTSHSKLWKRMGVAVMDGARQGGLSKGAGAESWVAHGYNRNRRSRLWTIGDCLIKSNRDGKYRTIYLARRELERQRVSKLHAHRRAQRYMEKCLLRDLWRAWRRAKIEVPEGPKLTCPPPPLQEDASLTT